MSNLYLLKFKNYYNRIVERRESLDMYSTFVIGEPLENINFIPNDGVHTTQVINWNDDIPDYVLVTDSTTIVSRWFVIESQRLLSGQFRLELYRDLVADYMDEILSAPIYLEKGLVSTKDSAIYNSEGMAFNQIKKSETMLKDSTAAAWVVGYISVPKDDENLEVNYGAGSIIPDITASFTAWQYKDYTDGTKVAVTVDNQKYDIKAIEMRTPYWGHTYHYNDNSYTGSNLASLPSSHTYYIYDADKVQYVAGYIPDMSNDLIALNSTYVNDYYVNLEQLENKIFKNSDDNKYYRLNIQTGPVSMAGPAVAGSTIATKLTSAVNSAAAVYGEIFRGAPNDNTFTYEANLTAKVLTMTEITSISGATVTIPKTRRILCDAPYCMFGMPYVDDRTVIVGGTTYHLTKLNALSVAAGIAASLGTAVYDVQLLPYCPISKLREDGFISVTGLTENVDYTVFPAANQIIYWAQESQDTFNVDYPITIPSSAKADCIEFKVKEETQMWRLSSPNYNGVFEFNAYKNNGVNYFTIDYTYKPYVPYIHVAPNFGGLYGTSFGDARGLICGGDFSLTSVLDQFAQYELQNKNYQEIFNRQIENLEVQNSVGRVQDITSALSGSISGAAGGAVTGAMVGGGVGAVAGAVVGGITSAVGGAADVYFNQLLRNETLDYTKDMYNYNLQNIKALPNSLTKVGALNFNNKIFPFLEYYSATDEEIDAFRNKLIYNGVSINRIGKIQDCLRYSMRDYAYVKGKLVRLESISDDFHIVNKIAEELNKGVFL